VDEVGTPAVQLLVVVQLVLVVPFQLVCPLMYWGIMAAHKQATSRKQAVLFIRLDLTGLPLPG
jgi:hypothetical protein